MIVLLRAAVWAALLGVVALSPLAARAAAFSLTVDLNNGTLFHNSPTFVHPSDPPGFVFGDGRKEIEDNYFSPTMRFGATLLNPAAPASNVLTLSIRFIDSDTGAQQYLAVDAKGTGSPFPETFAIRFPGVATHATIGPGFFLYGPSGAGTVGGIADGLVTTTLGTLIGAPAQNGYVVSTRCFIDNCTTGAHFPSSQDLTDTSFAFGSLDLTVRLTAFERCSLTRPDCGGITLGGFGFDMLAGDLAILTGAAPPIPEPQTFWLMGLGLIGVAGACRRTRVSAIPVRGRRTCSSCS
jgi:PEP-CTERM motif